MLDVEGFKGRSYGAEHSQHEAVDCKILILDDAIGSGATINEIALKIKTQKLAKVIIGVSITGSYKGFEVISEL